MTNNAAECGWVKIKAVGCDGVYHELEARACVDHSHIAQRGLAKWAASEREEMSCKCPEQHWPSIQWHDAGWNANRRPKSRKGGKKNTVGLAVMFLSALGALCLEQR